MSRRHRDSYVRRRLRHELRAFVLSNLAPLGVVVLLAAVAVLPAVLISGPFSRGFIVGMVVVAVPGLVFFGFLVHTGGLDQVVGALGEHLTREQLAQAVKRGHAWGSVHNIELGGRDIDHVVVAPGAILAIETKWHLRGASDWLLNRDVLQAQQSAELARSILRSKGIDYPHVVTPVVVVWGRGRLDIADGGPIVDGVRILCGEAFASWLADLQPAGIPQIDGIALVGRLEAFAAKRRRSGERNRPRSSVLAKPGRLRGPWRRRLA